MLVDELKRFADFGSDIFALRWVKANFVALPVSRPLRSVSVKDRFSVYLLDLNASSFIGTASLTLNVSLSYEMSDIPLVTETGRFLMVEGGWLESLWMYISRSLGLRYG